MEFSWIHCSFVGIKVKRSYIWALNMFMHKPNPYEALTDSKQPVKNQLPTVHVSLCIFRSVNMGR